MYVLEDHNDRFRLVSGTSKRKTFEYRRSNNLWLEDWTEQVRIGQDAFATKSEAWDGLVRRCLMRVAAQEKLLARERKRLCRLEEKSKTCPK